MKLKLIRVTWIPAVLLMLAGCGGETPSLDAKAAFKQADSLLTAGQVEEAITVLNEALKVDSTDFRGWYLLGEAYHSMDDCDAALEYYLKAERLNRADVSTQRNQGICYLAKGNAALALEGFEQVIASGEAVMQDYYYRARCYAAVDRTDDAYSDVMKAISMDSTGQFQDRFMAFVYESFSDDYLEQRYYEERNMKVTYSYNQDSVKDGAWSSYFEDGTVYQTGSYTDGVKDGKESVYYPGGTLQAEVLFEVGKIQGKRNTYFENGKLWTSVAYQNDQREGEALSYFEDGKIHKQEQYLAGKREGVQLEYFPDGRLAVRAEFVKGLEHGTTVFFDPEQDKYFKILFDNGSNLGMEEIGEVFDPAIHLQD